jgi:glyoxylase-like metal-dependent hydrolase (beta-lactamase superfamily II)
VKRTIVLGVLLAVGALAVAHAQQQQPKVIDVDKIKDNLFVLKGGGGNTAVFVTSTGVVVVDAKNPGWGQPILDKIKTLTPKPVTLLINTHTHGDHVSGNVEFPATVDVVVQENTKTNMQKMDIFKQHNNRGMAKRTFKDRMTIGKGADEIDLYYFGPGHTNGDAFVVFPALRTAHVGDIFAGKNLPLIDSANGGSVLHIADTLQSAHDAIKNVDTIVNGHMPTTTTWDDLQTYVQFNRDFVAWAQTELKAGRTPEQIGPDWKLPSRYQGYSGNVNELFGGVTGMLKRLQEETDTGRGALKH